MKSTTKAWLNAISLLVTLIVNTLGALGLINGLSQKQISDRYLTLITPSPSTFSIWSVIYALLIASMIVMLLKHETPYYQQAIDSISSLFLVSCLLNIAWIVAFSFVLIELSVLFILAFAITLALISRKLKSVQPGRRWLLPAAFGLYGGWLVIATVVNVAAALVKLQWNGFGLAADVWADIILIVAVILVGVILLGTRNAVYPLPVAWAYWGINRFLLAPEGFKGAYPVLQIVSLAGLAALVILAAYQFYRNHYALLPASAEN